MKNPVIETLVREEEQTETDPETSSLLELVAERTSAHKSPAGGVIVGKFAGFDTMGNPLVNFVTDISHDDVVARSMIALRRDQIGSDVVLAFEHGDVTKPIVTGLLLRPEISQSQKPVAAELDGERITLTAQKEVVLRCGKASITLNHDGKIVIRGTYLVSHAAGVNRIRGGSVQLN